MWSVYKKKIRQSYYYLGKSQVTHYQFVPQETLELPPPPHPLETSHDLLIILLIKKNGWRNFSALLHFYYFFNFSLCTIIVTWVGFFKSVFPDILQYTVEPCLTTTLIQPLRYNDYCVLAQQICHTFSCSYTSLMRPPCSPKTTQYDHSSPDKWNNHQKTIKVSVTCQSKLLAWKHSEHY